MNKIFEVKEINATCYEVATSFREYVVHYNSWLDIFTVIDVMIEENSKNNYQQAYIFVDYCHGKIKDSLDIIKDMIATYEKDHSYL